MTDLERIIRARELLADITPLKADCGALCAAACCAEPEDEDELSGMLLYPGEEALYPGADWYELCTLEDGQTLFVCYGNCPREQRPLACRIFPLVFAAKDGKPTTCMDKRGLGMCPLCRGKKSALRQDFVAAVQQAGETLWQSETLRAYIEALNRIIDEETKIL